ncbi:MAG: hypothetical protein HOO96_12275 [Polyangiaceae bacterium]|nr:hypothetical protein [Polyangiaceae bacterium]
MAADSTPPGATKARSSWPSGVVAFLVIAPFVAVIGVGVVVIRGVFGAWSGADCVDEGGAHAACQATAERAQVKGFTLACEYGSYGEHAHGGGCPQHRGFTFRSSSDAGAKAALSGQFSASPAGGALDCFDPARKIGMGFYVRPEDITPEHRALAAAACGAFTSP